MKLTNLNIPARFTNDDFKEKEVDRFRMNYPDMILFRQSYSSEIELARDKARWDMMGYDQRLISNELSLRLFGAKNEDRYPKLKSKFTKADIKNTELERTYSPSLKTYNEDFSDYGETFRASLNLSETRLLPFKYLNVINESTDILEQLYLIEAMQAIDTSNSIVGKVVQERALKLKEELLTTKPIDETKPLGYCIESYFTPKEVEDIGIKVTNESWYNNFKAKCYGIDRPQDNQVHLYNPCMVQKDGKLDKTGMENISKRFNEAFSKEIFTNREFIDLTEVSAYGAMSDKTYEALKGIYVYFVYSIVDNKVVTEVGISLDPRSDKMYKFENGRIYREVELKDLYDSEDAFMTIYFLPMTDELFNKISDKLNDMKTKNYHIKNFIKDICDILNIKHLSVMNEKLFFIYLSHLLISMTQHDDYIDDKLITPNKKIYSYILYKGEVGDFDRFGNGSPLAKLNMYSESYLDKTNLLEGYFRMPKLDLQVLLESNEDITEDKTGFDRIKYNDYIERTTKYSVE